MSEPDTRDWNDLSPELQTRLLAAVAETEQTGGIDRGDFTQYLDDDEPAVPNARIRAAAEQMARERAEP